MDQESIKALNAKLRENKKWEIPNLQIITLALLMLSLILIIKQQHDIEKLLDKVDYVETTLDQAESNLSSQISDVKTTVIRH